MMGYCGSTGATMIFDQGEDILLEGQWRATIGLGKCYGLQFLYTVALVWRHPITRYLAYVNGQSLVKPGSQLTGDKDYRSSEGQWQHAAKPVRHRLNCRVGFHCTDIPITECSNQEIQC